MLSLLLLAVTVFLAYANGANDNFKGAATLYGDGTLSYRQTLSLATVAQIAGSLASVVLAAALVKAFSGKGLVSPDISQSLAFLAAIGFGGATTVMLATVTGFPISTTHALTGALVGTALIANNGFVDVGLIATSFFLPLLLSPIFAVLTAAPLYRATRWTAEKLGVTSDSCLCVRARGVASGPLMAAVGTANTRAKMPFAQIGAESRCEQNDPAGQFVILRADAALKALHILSASSLCFARGLNDTPKIFGILFAAQILNTNLSLTAIAVAMAIGGLLQSRKVAERMSKKVTTMTEPQALIANLVASFYVIGASRLGLPVSTTHISVSSIIGVGVADKTANLHQVRDILLSWLLTLPIGALIGSLSYLALTSFGA